MAGPLSGALAEPFRPGWSTYAWHAVASAHWPGRGSGREQLPVDRWRAAESLLGTRVLTNQVAYSLMDRSAERDLLPFAQSRSA